MIAIPASRVLNRIVLSDTNRLMKSMAGAMCRIDPLMSGSKPQASWNGGIPDVIQAMFYQTMRKNNFVGYHYDNVSGDIRITGVVHPNTGRLSTVSVSSSLVAKHTNLSAVLKLKASELLTYSDILNIPLPSLEERPLQAIYDDFHTAHGLNKPGIAFDTEVGTDALLYSPNSYYYIVFDQITALFHGREALIENLLLCLMQSHADFTSASNSFLNARAEMLMEEFDEDLYDLGGTTLGRLQTAFYAAEKKADMKATIAAILAIPADESPLVPHLHTIAKTLLFILNNKVKCEFDSDNFQTIQEYWGDTFFEDPATIITRDAESIQFMLRECDGQMIELVDFLDMAHPQKNGRYIACNTILHTAIHALMTEVENRAKTNISEGQ